MSTTATPSNTTTTTTSAPAKKPLPVLNALEEDDEFEEFPAQDWDSSETYGSAIDKEAVAAGGTNTVTKKTGGLDSLWEDNWDDDDIEDDFSVQLKGELLKQDQAMQS